MNRVPTQCECKLVDAQFAGVEQAEHLYVIEDLAAQRSELAGAIFLEVPRVVGLLGAGWGEREHVGRRYVRGSAWRQGRAQVLEHGDRIVHVLDRLQKRDRVIAGRLAVAINQPPLEAEVLTPVAQGSVLIRLR